MPSIYICRDLGENWSDWEKLSVLEQFPEEFSSDDVEILFSISNGDERCYLYEPKNGLLTWSSWDADEWIDWERPLDIPPPQNLVVNEEDAHFSVVSHEDGDWLISINIADGTVYWYPLDSEDEEWDGPSYIDDPPNWDDSTDLFIASDLESEWLIAVNLEDQSIYFVEWDGEEFGSWEMLPPLEIPEIWLELGIKLDGVILDEDLLSIYAIVYDDDFEEEEYEELEDYDE